MRRGCMHAASQTKTFAFRNPAASGSWRGCCHVFPRRWTARSSISLTGVVFGRSPVQYNRSSRLASPIAAMFTTSSLALLTGVVLGMAANVYWYVAPQSPPSIPPAHAHPHPHHSTAAFMGASWSSSCRRVGARPGNSAVVELYRLQLTMNSPWGMANFGHTLAHRHPPMSDPSGTPRSARAG